MKEYVYLAKESSKQSIHNLTHLLLIIKCEKKEIDWEKNC